MTAQPIRIGTSGWSYNHWKGAFYPQRIGGDAMLAHYARHFDTVELNSTFYRLPAESTLRRWAETVPADFRFAVKASRYITHIKKLKDPADTVTPFLDRMRVLGNRLGPILFQLPPRFRYNGERLRALLNMLPGELEYAFEFRDDSWFNDEASALLTEHGAALCFYDLAGEGAPKTLTGGMVYARLHGPGEAYAGHYTAAALDHWARSLAAWATSGWPCWCFFDNDADAWAPHDARLLQQRVSALRMSRHRASDRS